MGRQIQVYLLPSDAVSVIAGVREREPLVLLARASNSQTPMVVDSPLVTQEGFTRADCLLVPNLSARIQMEQTKQGLWSVDTLISEVIEFTACYYDNKTIKRGRLYYDDGFYNDQGTWQDKSATFLRWAQSVFRVARKLLIRYEDLGAYVGHDAARWRKSGGVFISFAVKGQQPIVAGK